MSEQKYLCNFEVFGIVQGVFFRKYTQKQAKSINLNGWCRNTINGTVQGELEGTDIQIQQMQNWLQSTGSPQSRIDRAVFSEKKLITDNEARFKSFSIKN